MREKRITRVVALLLCLCTLFGSAAVIASAAEPDKESVTDISLDEIRELLNADSYGEYKEKHGKVDRGEKPISVDIFSYVTSGVAEGEKDQLKTFFETNSCSKKLQR